MSTEFDKDKVMERVRKMLRLANDAAAAEGERDNALRMAHSTLAKYNLTLAEAERDGQKSAGEPRTSGDLEVREHPWMRTVASAVSKLFFCNFFYVAGRQFRYRYYFVGRESNVYTTQEMFKYVVKSIDEEGRRVAKQETGNASGTYWRSFCKGAATKVYHRCIELERAPEQAVSAGTSLVLANVYAHERQANALYISDQMGRNVRPSVNRQRSPSAAAFERGTVYGSSIELRKSLGGTQKRIK